MSRVLNKPGQKSARIKICKKISTQPGPNLWWVGLIRGFQPILTTLCAAIFKGSSGECVRSFLDFLGYKLLYLCWIYIGACFEERLSNVFVREWFVFSFL